MGHVIGIDLGTTYSAVAVVNEAGIPEILPNSEGKNTTPSVVLFPETDSIDEPLVGEMAKRTAASSPADVVAFVKRQIPNLDFDFLPVGIDIRKVLKEGVCPAIHGGMFNRVGGLIGAGMARVPMQCFEKALVAFGEKYL